MNSINKIEERAVKSRLVKNKYGSTDVHEGFSIAAAFDNVSDKQSKVEPLKKQTTHRIESK
jgi:hypothetical protein